MGENRINETTVRTGLKNNSEDRLKETAVRTGLKKLE